jgi:hypothetical protein
MILCSEKLSKLEKIYAETREEFIKNSSHPLTKPESLGGKTGFCILYTPPLLNPDLMVIGQNPSVFTRHNGRSEVDYLMMSGQIPNINSYTKHDHDFAIKLKEIFGYEAEKANILDRCVGMNIWFFQGTDVNDETDFQAKTLRKFCEKQTLKILALLRPKTVFASGFKAFDLCNNMKKRKEIKSSKGVRYYAEGSFGGKIPIYGCPHITGAKRYYSHDEFQKGIALCKEGILTFLQN